MDDPRDPGPEPPAERRVRGQIDSPSVAAALHPDSLDDPMALVDLVNRVLDRGVVLRGDVTISVAGVDLVELGLALYVASAERARIPRRRGPGAESPAP